MKKKTPPKYTDWERTERVTPDALATRSEFKGMGPGEAAERLIELNTRVAKLREVTIRQKRMAMRRMLGDLAERGIDLGTLGNEEVEEYREYLASLAEGGYLSTDYLSHLARTWNSVMNAVFSSEEGVKMRGFPQKHRKVKRLSSEEVDRLVGALPMVRFSTEHHRRLFRTWLEVEWSTGARVGSLFTGKCTVSDIDWQSGTLTLRHMKNMEGPHEAVLTERAVLALKDWVAFLRDSDVFRGPGTPLFVGPSGKVVTQQWANRTLKGLAVAARVNKPVTTHVIRKSVGTLIGRYSDRYAWEQLGISREVYERHYNQPLLEDRLERRDLLPNRDRPLTAEEVAGSAVLALQAGRITPDEFQQEVKRAERLGALPERGRQHDPAYL